MCRGSTMRLVLLPIVIQGRLRFASGRTVRLGRALGNSRCIYYPHRSCTDCNTWYASDALKQQVPSKRRTKMSLVRVALSLVHAVCVTLVWIPPNQTRKEQQYAVDSAPAVFVVQMYGVYALVALEGISSLLPLYAPARLQPVYPTPLFIVGSIGLVLGTWIRLDCFRRLGKLFTFDLTIQPSHRLITSGFYAYARHPSYTGLILMTLGVHLSYFTAYSPFTNIMNASVPYWSSAILPVILILWWIWLLVVFGRRTIAEDHQLRKMFREEWDEYAKHVPWRFFPKIF